MLQSLDDRVVTRFRPVPLTDQDWPENGHSTWDLPWPPVETHQNQRPVRPRRLARRRGLLARLWGRDPLIEAEQDAVVAVDAGNRVVLYNPGAQALFGHPEADVLSRPADMLVVPAARGVLALLRRQVLDGARPGFGGEVVEVGGLRRDGTSFPAAIRLRLVRTREGPVVTASVRDVSERLAAQAHAQTLAAQLQDARDMISGVLRAISDRAVVVADADGRITAFNRGAERLLGYSEKDMIGRPTLCLSDSDDVAAAAAELGIRTGLDPLLEITRSGLPNRQEWTFLTKSGERRAVSLQITAIGDRRDPTGFVCVAHDLTVGWQPITTAHPGTDRLLRELDDAPTRTLRWQLGGSGTARRR